MAKAAPAEASPDEANADGVEPDAMEHDPNATEVVTPLDTKGKLPDDAEVHGEFKGALSWTDRYGKHALVFGLAVHEGEDENTTSVLVADFMSWEGSAWVSQRKFKERVEKCQFDTVLEPITGDWSVTDLDGDGLAELTFAWRAGCRSDVSPVSHKVLLVGFDDEAEVAKYALRGTTGIEVAGSLDPESSVKTDPAFGEAHKAFLTHAKSVWEKTSIERF